MFILALDTYIPVFIIQQKGCKIVFIVGTLASVLGDSPYLNMYKKKPLLVHFSDNFALILLDSMFILALDMYT